MVFLNGKLHSDILNQNV